MLYTLLFAAFLFISVNAEAPCTRF